MGRKHKVARALERRSWAGRAAVLAGIGLACASTAGNGAGLAAAADSGRWQFAVIPYVWMPNINGKTDASVPGLRRLDGLLENANLSATLGPNDYLNNLNFAAMLAAEARQGNWSVFTDIVYMDLGNQKTKIRNITGLRGRPLDTISRNTDTSFSSTLWTLGGGYTVARGRYGNLDVLAGFRYANITSKLTLQIVGSRDFLDGAYRVSLDRTEWDGIVGAKGQILFPDTHWFVPYYFDVGTGSSNWTWQAMAGLGYRFDWGDVTLALRSLSYEFNDNNASLRLTGPALGVAFTW
jgi:hypothetical protein